MSYLKLALVAGYAVVVSSSVSAQSGFTPLEDAPSSEASHADILASALGGTFSASGLNFTNGSITAIRNLDHDSGGEGGGSGGFFDQIWAARSYRATVIGHESDGSAHFGYVDGISGEDFTSLLNVRDIGSSASATIGDDFRWALQIGIEGIDPLFTSRESDNGVDAMGMDYSKMSALLIEAVKELKAENEELRKRIEALESR